MNSTPLGEVINERQLHRHRNAAGLRIGAGSHINLFRYVGWLAYTRHLKKSVPVIEYSELKRRAQERNRNGMEGGSISLSAHDILNMLKNQVYRCALSGRELQPDTVALDHVIPVSRGGSHSIDNAQALHKDVNRAKGTLTNEEFIELCHEVVRFTSRKERKKEAQS